MDPKRNSKPKMHPERAKGAIQHLFVRPTCGHGLCQTSAPRWLRGQARGKERCVWQGQRWLAPPDCGPQGPGSCCPWPRLQRPLPGPPATWPWPETLFFICLFFQLLYTVVSPTIGLFGFPSFWTPCFSQLRKTSNSEATIDPKRYIRPFRVPPGCVTALLACYLQFPGLSVLS